jgi:DNA-binding protein H-NS
VEISGKSRNDVIRELRQLVELYSLTPHELEGQTRSQSDSSWSATNDEVRKPVGIKYRHPVTGRTWSGEGAHPDWLRKALLHDGYTVAQLKPENQLESANETRAES